MFGDVKIYTYIVCVAPIKKPESNAAAIAGGVIGSLLLVALIGVGVYFIRR